MDSSGASRTSMSSIVSTALSTPPRSDPESEALKLKDITTRWRPSYHLLPANGWMNDPCAPGYDPKTGTYFVSFQWNPNGNDWGDIAWATATSADMVEWDVHPKPSLIPDMPHDQQGIFTGCFIPGDDVLTCAYTSVSRLPIHHTLPHPRGCESLSLAKSFDGGKTWVKNRHPVLPCEPEGLDVTAWRDPYVAPWPRMCKLIGLAAPSTLFGIISGGIRHLTPTTFLYSIDASDLTKWNYIGPLANFGLNLRPSRWSGDLGKNWEVTNFLTLKDEYSATSRDFVITGTEGCLEDNKLPPSIICGPTRPSRGQLWMSGTLQKRGPNSDVSGPVDMSYDFGGYLDHGCLYAANSFFDPRSEKQLVWGWITEEDLCDDLRHAQGWSGMLSMPRELRMQTLRYVTGALRSNLDDITSIEREPMSDGTVTIRTLASQPLQRLIDSLREGPDVRSACLRNSKLDGFGYNTAFTSEDVQTSRWEVNCSIRVSKHCRRVGISIGHSKSFAQATKLTFEPQSESFTIERPSFGVPNSSYLINTTPERAPHTLFTMRDPATGAEKVETLNIRAWRDNSVMEVFVNGRTAISTRIYAAEETFGMRFFADDSVEGLAEGSVRLPSKLLYANLWDGISTM